MHSAAIFVLVHGTKIKNMLFVGYSETFSVTDGVRQGGIQLFFRFTLTSYSLDCHDLVSIVTLVVNLLVGALGYADDIALLAPAFSVCYAHLSPRM